MDYCKKLLKKHDLVSNESANCNFVAISPTITWPSRTLPLSLYKELIKKIQANGDKVVIVGKTIELKQSELVGEKLVQNEQKNMYPVSEFEGVVDLTNQLTFAQLCAFYSLSKIAINTENGNMVASCTNNNCWNLYIATLNSPEFRLPWRKGSQEYRTLVAKNEDDYFPTTDYSKYLNNCSSVLDLAVRLPSVEIIYGKYLQIADNPGYHKCDSSY
jgi:ADP-heptose:LPS heptosyltransferase